MGTVTLVPLMKPLCEPEWNMDQGLANICAASGALNTRLFQTHQEEKLALAIIAPLPVQL
jgi:hypothetical protein